MKCSKTSARRQDSDLLKAALAYHGRGWSIIPIEAGTKKPACKRWKPFQSKRPDRAKLRRWFAKRTDYGLGVICGDISGGLTIRDFDTMDGYKLWQQQHPDLAETLPTVATARGRHVYFQSDHRGIVDMDDGELRGGGYCLLPPSRHPDGPVYEWLIPLPDGPLPFVEDVEAAGFLDRTPRATETPETTETTEDDRGQQKTTEAIVGGELGLDNLDFEISNAILETLPKQLRQPNGPGKRNPFVFEFARALQAIPHLADANPNDLEQYVRTWHDLGVAQGVIGSTSFDETRGDFIYGWPRVKFPKGEDPVTLIFERAKQAPMPAAASRYDSPEVRLLVALCRELQRVSGEAPFFLACRTAGKLFGVDYTTASRWFFLLRNDGLLEEVEKGSLIKRRASRYRYRGD